MAFELHQGRRGAGPAAQGPGEGGEQQVVDPRPVGGGGAVEQLRRALRVEADVDGLGVPGREAGIGPGARQRVAARGLVGPGQRLPGLGGRVGLEPLAPLPEGAGLGRQLQGLAGLELAVGRLQVVQQDAPGNAVDHQVVDHHQQALAFVGAVHQQRPQQRALGQVQAALGLLREGLQVRQPLQAVLPEQFRVVVEAPVLGVPAIGPLVEGHAQGVVMADQRVQGAGQQVGLQGLGRSQQHRLVPVVALGQFTLEEGVLHGQQRCRPGHRALVRHGRVVLQHLGDGGQATDGLVVEEVPGVKRRPSCRARLTTWIDRMESPPSSKKFSSMPMRSRLSTSCQIAAMRRSSSFCGLPGALGGAGIGVGQRGAVELAVGVSGRRSSITQCTGTMCSGSRCARACISSVRSACSSPRVASRGSSRPPAGGRRPCPRRARRPGEPGAAGRWRLRSRPVRCAGP